MTQRPSDGFGERLALYRRLAGLSAQALSDALGGELSRAVIANIESGRKKDVTIDQLVALAFALDVPPVALALPIDRPNLLVDVSTGPYGRTRVRAAELVKWFVTGNGLYTGQGPRTGNALVRTIMENVESLRSSNANEAKARKLLAEGDTSSDWAAIAEEENLFAARTEERLVELGVDLSTIPADQPEGATD